MMMDGMAFILDGNSEISSHAWSEIGILIYLWRARPVANLPFIYENTFFSSQVKDMQKKTKKT